MHADDLNPYESPKSTDAPQPESAIFSQIEGDFVSDLESPVAGILWGLTKIGCVMALIGGAAVIWLLRALLNAKLD